MKEGVVSQFMLGIFDYYLIPLALFLGAGTPQIGLLAAIPSLLSAFSQFIAVAAVHLAGSAKKLLVWGTFIQAVLILPIGFLGFMHVPGAIWILIILVSVFRVLGSVFGPAWGSLVSRYLKENARGDYFGRRSQLTAIAGVINLYIWGIFLSWMKHWSLAAGFFIVFLTAACVRFVSCYYMTQLMDVKVKEEPHDRFTFWMFIRRFKESNFVKYIFYLAGITFAAQLSGAYFSVYMLRDLKFDYSTYMLVNLSTMVAGLLVFPIWGRHADVVGNAKIIKLTGTLLPISPLLWAVFHQPWQLMMNEAFSGFVWGGFNLCSVNFIYDIVSPSKRVRCLGYFNLINGGAMFLGAGLGGCLAKDLPAIHGSPLVTLFLLSALVRFLSHQFLSPHWEEVREVKHMPSDKLFFSVLGIRPLIGRNLEWPVFSFRRWFFFRKPKRA